MGRYNEARVSNAPRLPPGLAGDELSQLFFQGRYDELLRQAGASIGSHPALVGSLAMVGRLEEAETVAHLTRDDAGDFAARSMTSFVLCMGQCHAGNYEKARQHAAVLLWKGRRSDPLQLFFAHQAAALVRYFEGRLRLAKHHALQALAYSWRCGLDYARLIASELSGHVAFQLGDLEKGLRILDDAEHLALSLGYDANAQTIRTSWLIYATHTHDHRKRALTELAELLDRDSVSEFARRNGLLRQAFADALAGSGRRALHKLEEAARLARRNEDQRGELRVQCYRAFVRALQGKAQGPGFAQLFEQLSNDERARGELSFMAALVGAAIDVPYLTDLARRTGLHLAQLAIKISAGTGSSTTTLWPARDLLVASSETRRTHLVEQLAHADALALLPRCLGLKPRRRVYLDRSRWVVEDEGDFFIVEQPVRHGAELLRALARGRRSKEDLVVALWKTSYNAALHDATLQKLISRTRKVLGRAGLWIVSTTEGYSLESEVELESLDNETALASPCTADAPASEPINNTPTHLAVMKKLGSFTSVELARAHGSSKATALRLIRRELKLGRLQKHGTGKSTRYQLSPSP